MNQNTIKIFHAYCCLQTSNIWLREKIGHKGVFCSVRIGCFVENFANYGFAMKLNVSDQLLLVTNEMHTSSENIFCFLNVLFLELINKTIGVGKIDYKVEDDLVIGV